MHLQFEPVEKDDEYNAGHLRKGLSAPRSISGGFSEALLNIICQSTFLDLRRTMKL